MTQTISKEKSLSFSNRSKLLDFYTLEEIKDKRKWLKDNESKKITNLNFGVSYSSDNWDDNEFYDFKMNLLDDDVHYFYHNRITNEWLYGHIETTILYTFKDKLKENYILLDKKYNLDGLSFKKIDDNHKIYYENTFIDPHAEKILASDLLSVSLKEDRWITERVVTDEIEIENLFLSSINPRVSNNRTYLEMWEDFWCYYSSDTQFYIKEKEKREEIRKFWAHSNRPFIPVVRKPIKINTHAGFTSVNHFYGANNSYFTYDIGDIGDDKVKELKDGFTEEVLLNRGKQDVYIHTDSQMFGTYPIEDLKFLIKNYIMFEWGQDMVESLHDGKFICLVITNIGPFMLHIDKIRNAVKKLNSYLNTTSEGREKYNKEKDAVFAMVEPHLPTYNFSE